MKTTKALLFLTLFFISLFSYAQLAVVYDKDGFVNVREKPSKTS